MMQLKLTGQSNIFALQSKNKDFRGIIKGVNLIKNGTIEIDWKTWYEGVMG